MSPRAEMIGKKFGRLTVTRLSENRSTDNRLMYYCDCDCGTKDIEVTGKNLRNGNTQSCGCLQKERAREANRKHNKYDLSGEYGIGWTTNTNKEFYFDLEDYEKIKNYCWLENKQRGYIYSARLRSSNGKKILDLHRFIVNAIEGEIVDHINHNVQDNRKCNLRLVNQSKNMMNAKLSSANSSGYTGVYFSKQKNNWVAQIRVNYKVIYLGTFTNKIDAINARRKAEEQYFGEYSFKNSNGFYNNEIEKMEVAN